ncbi:hypothetical protein KK060_15000 [Fulvivirgaceae bacterium PWU20]|uniref:Uncharacterized protein n=1 Tax=Chryseosolibacter indicus TaxID=2782351 RepID=A0ABS5VV25_9BACT|nr:hypothetical protein [Chryseosolibacter indicus]
MEEKADLDIGGFCQDLTEEVYLCELKRLCEFMRRYTYLGDKLTDGALKGAGCYAIERQDGKCIRGRNGTMLV